MMRQQIGATLLALACSFWSAPVAQACGGFFCSSSPVDQNAEKIIFAVNEAEETTDMIVQIAYQGEDDAFAWLLPVGSVPQQREVFPALALSTFDSRTSPSFQLPPECQQLSSAGSIRDAGVTANRPGALPAAPDEVTVYVMETVDAYDVAVIGSESADKTFEWLLSNGYRLSSVMKPYIELYTAQKMLFLALKLTADATTRDIKPFKMTLPGTTPSIPLRLTAIAAEPEMGAVVWILGQQRYEPANTDEITIPKDELRWRPNTYPTLTNWTQLVAKHVDERGGRAWVVEQSGPTSGIMQAVMSSRTGSQDQFTAQQALLKLLTGHPHMTRLYTRISAEEMGYDPSFKRSDKPDVEQVHVLPYVEELCSHDAGPQPSIDPCDFTTCGSLGVCRSAMDDETKSIVAGCACAPGTSARTTFDPQGAPTVVCQDQRMSFMNPGENDEAGAQFIDPCVGYSCGDHGQCVSMNLTPTCVCEQGYVAVGGLAQKGKRQTRCALPTAAIDKSFYNRRPPALAEGMVAGRQVTVPPAKGRADVQTPARYGDPVPASPLGNASDKDKGDDGCSAGSSRGRSSAAPAWLVLATALWYRRRRKA
ncbi:MAG: putative rane-associated protein [Myxococcaceae bacterium]|nr:putative rane-associated protein [Myxococcaceae bacterium]